jgi:hypothetical protein
MEWLEHMTCMEEKWKHRVLEGTHEGKIPLEVLGVGGGG